MKYDIALEMNKFLNEIYKIKKVASEEDEEENIKEKLVPFDEGYDYFKGGGFARAYRSKEDPSKVRLETIGDYSRTILANINEDNPYIPKLSEMSQYTNLEKNVRVYDMQYYPKLNEYTSAFIDYIELTNVRRDSGFGEKCIASSAKNGIRLSDYLKESPKIPQKLYEAILLIENEIIKSDHDFWWDFNFPNFAMMEDVEDFETQLILLDPLSPCGGRYNQRNGGSGEELIVPDEIIIASVKEKLIKLADMLDLKKLHKEADMVDRLISFASEDDENVIDFFKEKSRIEDERQSFNRRINMFSEIMEDGDISTIYDIEGVFSDTVDKYEMPERLRNEFYSSGMEIRSFIEHLEDEGRESDLNKIYIEKLE